MQQFSRKSQGPRDALPSVDPGSNASGHMGINNLPVLPGPTTPPHHMLNNQIQL